MKTFVDFEKLENAYFKDNREELIKKLLAEGVNPNALDDKEKGVSTYQTILVQFCASSKNLEIVKMLLAAGADPNLIDKNSVLANTVKIPLAEAARFNCIEICKALVDAGADVNIIDPCYGWSVLFEAINNGAEEAVVFLLENGADAHAVIHPGSSCEETQTTVQFAKEYKQKKIAALLEDFIKKSS